MENQTPSPAYEAFPVLYGVWLPGEGWLRAHVKTSPLTFAQKEVADEVAARLGGKVYYCDQSLVDIEDRLLKAENAKAQEQNRKKSLWHTLTSSLHTSNS